jgi:archaellum component FlaF (FlaF/FlaG flagellin family)
LGFASIGSFIMLFFAVLIVVSSFTVIYGRLIESSALANEIQNEKLENEVNTKIEIQNISFNNLTTPDTTTVYIKNTGINKIELEYFEIYIDNLKIPRNQNNRTMMYAVGSNVINPLHWDPREIIEIEVFLNLENITHIFTATTEYGVKDSITFLG